MALETTNLVRKFILEQKGKNIDLADPNPEISPEEVMKFYSSEHPELTNALIDGPKVEGDKAVYRFSTKAGQLG